MENTFLNQENPDKELFDKSVDYMPIGRQNGDDDTRRMGGILNAVCAIKPDYNYYHPQMAFDLFFGSGTTIDEAENRLEAIRELTRNSDQNALSDFKKLSEKEQDKIVREKSPDAKVRETKVAPGGYGYIISYKDNPNFDPQKAKEEYEQELENKNTWQAYLRLRENFSTDIINDVFRFKTSVDSRTNVAELYVDKFLEDPEWARDFSAALQMFSPKTSAGFWGRVGTRIGENFTDSIQNIKDYFYHSEKAEWVLFSMAQKRGLFDEKGNLTSDENALKKLKEDFISEMASRENAKVSVASPNSMGGNIYSALKTTNALYGKSDIAKLVEDGKKLFERRKYIRELRSALATQYDYSDGEWETLENAFVYGFDSLKYIGLGAAGTAATGSPWGGIAFNFAMMYAEEASSMYGDLRFSGASESDAAVLSAGYGVIAAELEDLQVTKLGKFFKASPAVAGSFKEYILLGVKNFLKNGTKEAVDQTATELMQSTLGYATKMWAAEHANATFEEKELWDNYCEEVKMLLITMPMITGGFWFFGAPARARGHLKGVGANWGSAVKGLVHPIDVLENNVQSIGAIQSAENYAEEVKNTLGANQEGREWLKQYFGAGTEEEKTRLLNNRFEDDNERYNATLMLQNLPQIDKAATKAYLDIKIDAAKKRQEESRRILGGENTAELAVLDETGDKTYSILEQTIHSLGMESDVLFINDAGELADAVKISRVEAERVINDNRNRGFFETKSGKIVILKEHLSSGADAITTFAHEYGHFIMAKIRQNDLNGYKRMCNEVLSIIGGENFARSVLLPNEYSMQGSSQYAETAEDVAEEVLMRVIEDVALKRAIDAKKKSVWARFKAWFSGLFDAKTLSDISNERLAEIALSVLQNKKTFDVKIPAPSKKWRATTPEAQGDEASGEYEIIDASELIASTDEGYDDALQPRNRSRQSSKEQVADIAAHLNPKRLDSSETTDEGAPIIDGRKMVVSGNGRVLAIREAYESGRAEEYRRYVLSRAKAMGLDVPMAYKNPVLVRRVDNTGNLALEEFAARSNKSQVARMSVAEQAVADGRRIIEAKLLDSFFPDASGNVLAASNRDFINAFLNIVGGSEQYRNKDGSIRGNLAPRIKAAVLAAMLNKEGNRETIERLLDNPEGYSAIINGLMQSAANVAELSQKPDYDISSELSDAVDLYVEIRNKGQTVDEFLAQGDMFREMPAEEVVFLLRLFEENQKSQSGISGVLTQYASECKKIDTTTQALFADDNPTKIEKLQSAYNHYALDLAQNSNQGNLKARVEDEGKWNPEEVKNEILSQKRIVIKSDKTTSAIISEFKARSKGWVKRIIDILAPLLPKSVSTRLGDVAISNGSIRSALRHSSGELKVQVLPQLEEIISDSIPITENAVIRNDGQLSYPIARAIEWDGVPYIMTSVILEDKNGKRFYDHELAEIERLDDAVSSGEDLYPRATGTNTHHRALNEILFNDIWNVNKNSQNLKFSFRDTRSEAELGALNNKHRELYERYKNGDQAAYEEAAKLVAEEARRKGYEVKVYHGTGSDGFNVADASSKYEENGEGNQAHGAGLYLAVSKETAEGYWQRARKSKEITVGGKAPAEFGITPEALGYGEIDYILEKLAWAATTPFYKNGMRSWLHAVKKQLAALEDEVKHCEYELNNPNAKEDKSSRESALSNARKKVEEKKNEYKATEKIISILEKNNVLANVKRGEGKVFDWFTNLNKENTLDEDKKFSEQNPEIRKKLKQLSEDFAEFKELASAIERNFDGRNIYGILEDEIRNADEEYMSSKGFPNAWRKVNKVLLDYGIKGITYDGRQDGRCYVSFEGGATVKLQDPFTFNDAGELIPLSERFNEQNPDIRWSVKDSESNYSNKWHSFENGIVGLYQATSDEILNSGDLSVVEIDKDSLNEILGVIGDRKYKKAENVLRGFFKDILSKMIGMEFDLSSIGRPNSENLKAVFNSESKREIASRLKNKVVASAVKKAKDIYEKGRYLTENDNFIYCISAIKIDSELFPVRWTIKKLSNGKFVIYDIGAWTKKRRELSESQPSRKTPSSAIKKLSFYGLNIRDLFMISQEDSPNIKSKENRTSLRALLRQERSENPVVWASIILAREILQNKPITQAKLEKVLPSAKFDGTKRQYAIDRAKQIAEHCKATQENYRERLDEAVQLAEIDVYWNREVMQEAYNSFRRDGEEYGIAKQKLLDWLKKEQQKDLEKVKGLSAEELGMDVSGEIENALEKEPERKKPEESEAEEEEFEEIPEEGVDEEIAGAKEKAAPSSIRDIVSKIRMGVTKAVKRGDGDEAARRRVYRNTLVNVLTDAAKRLTYGKERESIMKKISELSQKGYAVIKIKKGDRTGQKIDNFTLRAEHIALRIFNRGVRDTKAELIEKLKKALQNIKSPKRVMRDDKRKMTGKAQERAKSIKNIADMSIEEIDAEIEKTMDAINKAGSKAAEEYEAKLIDAVSYLEDLQRFGAFREKSRADMAEAVDWIENYLESETEKHAEKVEELKREAAGRRQIFIDAINEIGRNANFDGKTRKRFRALFNSTLTFKDLLLTLGRAATGERRKAFEKLVSSMAMDCYAATTQKENEILARQSEFQEAIAQIYGMSARDAFKHILGGSDKLQRFSVQGKPMSVQIALQRLSMAEQENYRNNVFVHCIKDTEKSKSYKERIAQIDEKWSGLEKSGSEYEADMAEKKLLKEKLDAEISSAVENYARELRSALSEEDLKLLEWFRSFYKRERGSLSDANEAITGLGIPEADPNYTPMKMLREGGTNERIQVVAIVPKSLSPRVSNSLDMDESVGIVDIWNSRVAENAHYKAFSQLNIEWRGIFAHADFHKAVKTKLGNDVLNHLLDFFNDIMSVHVSNGLKLDAIDKLSGLYAVSALGFNLGSAWRQTTSIPAFFNFMGIKDFLSYTKEGIIPAHLTAISGGKLAGKIGNPEARQAVKEILNSDTAKRRMSKGNNQVLIEALDNIEDNKFWAWYKRNALVLNRWGDVVPILTVGQGFYRAKTKEYAKTMPLEKAKEKAMNEMWMIAEMSQQSPSIMNAPVWTRKGGSIGKSAALFTSFPQLMLSREVEAFNRFSAVREKYKQNPNDAEIREDYLKARKEFAKTVFINHVLGQGGYMFATLIWKSLLGDDWDESDWYVLLGETIAGPMGGLIVFGRFITAFYSKYSVSTMPLEGFGRTIGNSVELVQDLITLDWEDVAKDLDKIGRNLFAPYRDASKLYKNATDGKEGVLW